MSAFCNFLRRLCYAVLCCVNAAHAVLAAGENYIQQPRTDERTKKTPFLIVPFGGETSKKDAVHLLRPLRTIQHNVCKAETQGFRNRRHMANSRTGTHIQSITLVYITQYIVFVKIKTPYIELLTAGQAILLPLHGIPHGAPHLHSGKIDHRATRTKRFQAKIAFSPRRFHGIRLFQKRSISK